MFSYRPANVSGWTPQGWRAKRIKHVPDLSGLEDAYEEAEAQLSKTAPLVTIDGILRLRELLTEAARGQAFLLSGGDCAESFKEFEETGGDNVRQTLSTLKTAAFAAQAATEKPVVVLGRMAGQYTKPRTVGSETQNGVTMNTFWGDNVNRFEFDADKRRPDAQRMVKAYEHSANVWKKINEHWDSLPVDEASLSAALDIARPSDNAAHPHFANVEAKLAEGAHKSFKPEFFTCHEALLLNYEEPMTRYDEASEKWYNMSAHFVWVGNKTRQLDGAHIDYIRGINNPIGIKLGADLTPEALSWLLDWVNPLNEEGKVVLIPRVGQDQLDTNLFGWIKMLRNKKANVVWLCDPMHGNTIKTSNGMKTRPYEYVQKELETFVTLQRTVGDQCMGGFMMEMTGLPVTECTGGPDKLSEEDLLKNYGTMCDPRFNAVQALQLMCDFIHATERPVEEHFKPLYVQQMLKARGSAVKREKKLGTYISASVLASNFAALGAESERAVAAGCDWIHLDIFDGHFVPNLTIGPPVVKALRSVFSGFLDCHLCVTNPEAYVEELAKAGANTFTFHIEAVGMDLSAAMSIITDVHKQGMKAGIALSPGTPVESIDPLVDYLDLVLLMTVLPGFGGQKFMPRIMSKVKYLRERNPLLTIGCDGGINPSVISTVAEAGANYVVAGSAIYKAPLGPKHATDEMRRALEGAIHGNHPESAAPAQAVSAASAASKDADTVVRGTMESLVPRVRKMCSGMFSDELDQMGFRHQVITGLKINQAGLSFFGRARTVSILTKPTPNENIMMGLSFLESTEPGEVVCVSGSDHFAYFGELMTRLSLRQKLSGVVIGGLTRDSIFTQQIGDLCICAGGYSPVDIKGRGCVEAVDVPILIYDVPVHPGDWIFGDQDGVVVVPQQAEAELAHRIHTAIDGEADIIRRINAGERVASILEHHAAF